MRWSRESFSLQSSSSAVKRSHVPSSFWSSFCYCLRVSMTPAVQAFCHSIVSKNGHGIFNVRNDAGACCALEVETGIKECTSVGGTGEKHTHAHTHTRTHARTHTHQTKPNTKTPPPTHTHITWNNNNKTSPSPWCVQESNPGSAATLCKMTGRCISETSPRTP